MVSFNMTQSLIKVTAIERIPGPNRMVITNQSGDLELPPTAELTVYERANLPASTFTVTDPRLFPFMLDPATADGTTILQQCIDTVASTGGGCVLLPFMIPVSREIVVPENVDLVGLTKACGLRVRTYLTANYVLNTVICAVPTVTASPTGRKHTLKGFTIDAQYHGAFVLSGLFGGTSVFNHSWTGSGAIPLGSLVEGVGIPKYTNVFGISGTTLTLSEELTGTNNSDTAVIRPCVRTTATSLLGSTTVQLTSTSGLVAGMRVTGAGLRTSIDDHPDVVIVSVAETSIVVSRPANSSSSFELVAWIEVDAIRIVASTVGNQSPAPVILDDITLVGVSGTGIIVDAGRGGCQFGVTTANQCKRDGVRVRSVASFTLDDSYVSAWATPLSITDTPEFRSSRLKVSGTSMIDKCVSIDMHNVARATLISTTIPASISVVSTTRSAVHLIDPVFTWSDDNFFSTSSLMFRQAYVHAQNAHVHMSNPTFVVTASMSPNHILNSIEKGTMSLVGGVLAADGSNAYQAGISNDLTAVARLTVDKDGGFMTMGHGTWQPTVSTDISGNLTVQYGARHGSYTVLPGGIAYVTFDMSFTPYYTTAQGSLMVEGLGNVIQLDEYFNTNPISAVITSSSQWVTGSTQLYGEVNGSGIVRIIQTGAMVFGSSADFDLLTNSGEPVRIVGWGTVRLNTTAEAPTNLWVDANTWDDAMGWVD